MPGRVYLGGIIDLGCGFATIEWVFPYGVASFIFTKA